MEGDSGAGANSTGAQNEKQQPKFSDKFYILYKATNAPDYFRPPNHEEDEEEETDRKLLYQCESAETAQYIVAKLKTQRRLITSGYVKLVRKP